MEKNKEVYTIDSQNMIRAIGALILILSFLNGNPLRSQYLVSGNNLYSSARFISPGPDSSVYITGEYLTYELHDTSGYIFESSKLEINDSTIEAGSCGYPHFSTKLFVSSMDKKGEVNWIRSAQQCDSNSQFRVIQTASDALNNLYLLGMYRSSIDLNDTILSTNAVWDMFVYKISALGEVLWGLGSFALSDDTEITPTDLSIIDNTPYISGGYKGNAAFVDTTLTAIKKQFFILELTETGMQQCITAGCALRDSASSNLYGIDTKTNHHIVGGISANDSILVVRKSRNSNTDTLANINAFKFNRHYIIDSIYLDPLFAVIDSFYLTIDLDTALVDSLYYILDYFENPHDSIIFDSLLIADITDTQTHHYIMEFLSDTVLQITEHPVPADHFLVDRVNGDDLVACYNQTGEMVIGNTSLISPHYPAVTIVSFSETGNLNWSTTGFATNDTVTVASICTDNVSNYYLAGFINNNPFQIDGKTYPANDEKDGFVLKINQLQVEWCQVFGDSAIDKVNDVYAFDEFTIATTGDFASKLSMGIFTIQNSRGKELFAGMLDPFPDFDLAVWSSYNENIPLCEGDSILLIAQSSHNCSFSWIKDSVAIASEQNDSLWIYETGEYILQATSNELIRPSGHFYSKYSKALSYHFNPYPNTSIQILDEPTICEGEETMLAIQLLSSDQCVWQNLSEGTIDTASYLKVTQSGNYFATIKGKSGCVIQTDTIPIVVIPLPDDSVSIAGNRNKFCDGDSLFIQCHDPGNNIYIWYHNGDSIKKIYTPLTSFKQEGRYAVDIIVDGYDCTTHVDSIFLVKIIPPELQQSFPAKITGICDGDSAIIELSLHPQTTYTWFHNNDTLKDVNTNMIYASEPGYYQSHIVKSEVCYAQSDTFQLTVYELPEIDLNITGDTILCNNESTSLSIESTSSLTYNWYKDEKIIEEEHNPFIDINNSGIYFARVNDSNGCTNYSQPVSVFVKIAPSQTIAAANGKTAFCQNDSLRIYVQNPLPYIYSWFKNNIEINTQNATEIHVSQPGSYALHIHDTVSNCKSFTNSLTITALALPDNTIAYNSPTPLCNRDTLTLTANAKSVEYTWYHNNAEMILHQDQSIGVFKNGTYQLKVEDSNNCSNRSEAIHFNFLENPVPPIQQDKKYLSTLHYNKLQWYKMNTPLNGYIQQVYLVTESGRYRVEVTHENGCKSFSKFIQVCVPLPELTIDKNKITASEGIAYQWFYENDTIFGAHNSVYFAQLTGNYSVDITLSDQCVSRSEAVKICYPVPAIEIEPNNVLESSLGLAYQWYLNGEPIPDADARLHVAQKNGYYRVEVTNLDGCISFSDPVLLQVTDVLNQEYFSNLIFPNPAKQQIRIRLPETINRPIRLIIFDATGNRILEKAPLSNDKFVDVSMLNAGLYIVQLYMGDYSIQQLLTIQ